MVDHRFAKRTVGESEEPQPGEVLPAFFAGEEGPERLVGRVGVDQRDVGIDEGFGTVGKATGEQAIVEHAHVHEHIRGVGVVHHLHP